jgi:hypothetical protein
MRSRVSQAAAGLARTVREGRARFWPRSRLKIKNYVSIFIQFQIEFKIQKFVSKYRELQKL